MKFQYTSDQIIVNPSGAQGVPGEPGVPLPYTLLGGAPHPPDPPGLKIHAKLNFQKIPRPNFQKLNFQKISRPIFFLIPRGPCGILINPWGPRGPIKNTFKNKVKLRFIYKSLEEYCALE